MEQGVSQGQTAAMKIAGWKNRICPFFKINWRSAANSKRKAASVQSLFQCLESASPTNGAVFSFSSPFPLIL